MKAWKFLLIAAVVLTAGFAFTLMAVPEGDRSTTEDECSIHGGSCSGCGSSAEKTSELTDDERKVVDFIAGQVLETGQARFDSEQIEEATGVSIGNIPQATIRAAVMADLERRNINLEQCANNCSRFSACSVNMDLSGATGGELDRYYEEKSLDGKTFTDWTAPDFTLPRTDGGTVTLSDYRGQSVALFFLAGHCRHSLQTIPIITELKKKFEPSGLVVLPVYVNSGSVHDVEYLRSGLGLDYPIIVSESKRVAEAYGSRMVPSIFLIDEEGQITKKFVGFKDHEILAGAFEDLANL